MFKRGMIVLGATAIAGALSGFCLLLVKPWGLEIGPGIFFGLGTSIAFYLLYKPNILKLLLWFVIMIAAWYIALQLVLNKEMLGQLSSAASLTAAGGLGGFLVVSAFGLLIKKVSQVRFFVTVVLGCLLGMAMAYIFYLSKKVGGLQFALAFMVWQVGIGLALTFRLSVEKEKKS